MIRNMELANTAAHHWGCRMKAHEIANKEELIKALRRCGKAGTDRCWNCSYYDREPWCEAALVNDAADALEVAEQRIAEIDRQAITPAQR